MQLRQGAAADHEMCRGSTGEMNAYVSAGCATVNGQALGVRKRGAKPKYKFLTAEEAIAHRCAS